ncbi:MAG TPA: bidirectional hydrogenase complex protein HoxE [Gemmataceae bacterium]
MTTDPPPVPDDRASRLDAAMRRHQYRQDALIEVLHAAQGLYGHLGPELLYSIARRLKLPPSRVYGVATFYHFFTLEPMGRHACVVCTGTACYVHGADDLVAAVAREAGVGPGGTTADGAVSLLTARCLGACGAAPVAVLDGEILGFQTADGLVREVKGWLAGGTVGPE